MLREKLQHRVVDPVGNSEGPGGDRFAVREKAKLDLMFFDRLVDLRWLIRRNGKNLKSIIANLGLYVTQLNQLPAAVGSPTSTIKHQHGRHSLDGR